MKSLTKQLLLIVLMLSTPFRVMGQQSLLENTRTQVAKATKVENLYQVRIQLKKAAAVKSMNANDLQELAESFRILSGGFARFNHYKNSVEAYTNYLQFTEKSIDKNRVMQIDSINTAHQRIERAELEEISRLQKNMDALVAKKDVLSDYKGNYFMWSAIFAACLIIFFLYTYNNLNRKVKDTQTALADNNTEIDVLFSKSVFARIESSIPEFLRNYATRSSSVMTKLTEPKNTETGSSNISGDFKKQVETLAAKFKSLG